MRFGRVTIIPAILALSAAGSILVASAVPVAAAQAPTTQVHHATLHMRPLMHYHS